MNWVTIAILAVVVIIAVLVIVKICLRRRLNNIDGLHGVHTENLNSNEGTVIGSFGTETPSDKVG